MIKEDFRSMLFQWKEFVLPELVEREIRIPLDSSNIVSLVGVRRSGKTYLVFNIIENLLKKLTKDNVIYVNFEHELLRNLDVKELSYLIESIGEVFNPKDNMPRYLFLDEIQRVRDWELWVRRIYDERKFRIFITGSSSRILPREIASSLRGRTINFTVYPFSFREFLKARNFVTSVDEIEHLEEKRGRLFRLLREYLEFGGFPEVVLKKDRDEKTRLLSSYFDAVIYRDIIERFEIRDVRLLEDFIRYVINNSSSYFSLTKAENFFKSRGEKCSKKTLSDFLRYSQTSLLLFTAEIYSKRIKDRMQYPRKVYSVDTGLINFVNPRFSENIGKLMENTVFIELLRRKGRDSRIEIFYWKEYGGRESEADFVIKRGVRIEELIQVTYAGSGEIKEREVRGLLKASEELGCRNLLVITWDHEGTETRKGKRIRFTPLWKWLLNQNPKVR